MALAWYRRSDETAEQFAYFVAWRQLPLASKPKRQALLAALDLPVTQVNRNRVNRWRKRFAWDHRESERLAAAAARTDAALAKRRRDLQIALLNKSLLMLLDRPDPLVVGMITAESRIRRDDALVPSGGRASDAAAAAREFMGLA